MGCSGCKKRRESRMNKRRYKYLTHTQINKRFDDFKNKFCSEVCEDIDSCSLDTYRKCTRKKEVFELL